MQSKRGALIEALMASPDFATNFYPRLLLLSGARPVATGTPFDPYFRWLETEVADPSFSLHNFFRNSLAGDLLPMAGQQGAIATAWTRLPTRTDLITLPRRVAHSYLALDLTRPPNPQDIWPDATTAIPLFLPEDNAPPFRDHLAVPPFLPLHTPTQMNALEAAEQNESALWLNTEEPPVNAEENFKAWLAQEDPAVTIPDLAVAMTFNEGLPADSAPIPRAGIASLPQFIPGVQEEAIVAPADFTGLPLSSSRAFTLSFFLKIPLLPEESTPILLATSPGGAPVGFRVSLSQDKLAIQLLQGSDANSISAEAALLPTPEHWHHIAIGYDGSRSAGGLRLWIDAAPVPLTTTQDSLYGIAQAPQGELLFRSPPDSVAPAAIDELQIYQSLLSGIEVAHLRDGTALLDAVREEYPREDTLFHYYLRSQSAPSREARQAAITASSRVGLLQDSALLVPVAADGKLPEVRPSLPFNSLPMDASADRLGLANWLFADENPLTPRVVASRRYQMVYGLSLLPESGDLSDPWELPPHPQLLEFLARELVDQNWNFRAILRTILRNPPPSLGARTANL
jgi:hypothetical protein